MDCSTFAFDLHVLGTPPALILSQDQTLKLNLLSPPEGGGNSFNPISLFNLALGFIPPSPSLALGLRRAVQVMGGLAPEGAATR
jgi:hypothetical protein